MRSDVFFDAVQAKDVAAMRAALADDVRFLSPVVFRPYEGRELVAGSTHILWNPKRGLVKLRQLTGAPSRVHTT